MLIRRLAGAAGSLVPHASTHASSGSDPVSPSSIGAASSSHTHSQLHDRQHDIAAADHSTTAPAGKFVKTGSSGSIVTADHGLTYTDVGAAAASHTHSQLHDRYHDIAAVDHSTTAPSGKFVKTGVGGTIVTADHGLTYTDVGAAAASHTHSYAPLTHASQHASGGSDPVTLSSIGAAAATHASQHASGGADPVSPESIGAATSSHTHSQLHDRYHDITAVDHSTTASSGKFVKTGAGGAIVVADHGLTYTDVGAAAASHTHSQLHDRQHAVVSTDDHTFPGGTSNFLRADGTWATPPSGGGSSPPWAGNLYGAAFDGNPGFLLEHCQTVGVVSPTPTNIGTSTARCSLFTIPADILVGKIYFYGVGAVTGAYRLAIYNYSTKGQVLPQTTFNTTASTWNTITPGSSFNLYAGVLYVLAVAVSTTSTAAGVLAFGATMASTSGVIAVAPESWPTALRPSSGYVCCALGQFAVTSGALPTTMPSLAAGAAWTGGMPAFWLGK